MSNDEREAEREAERKQRQEANWREFQERVRADQEIRKQRENDGR